MKFMAIKNEGIPLATVAEGILLIGASVEFCGTVDKSAESPIKINNR
ncbi:histidyl-tRNA synthetase [Bacillus sp. SG-1]|nr:histidyl-tRNA synthetase [Bacillus sp. SG-1]